MRIFVKAKTGASKEHVEKIDSTHFNVAVHETPQRGNANRAIIKALADYFDIAPSRIEVVSGFTGTRKVFSIE